MRERASLREQRVIPISSTNIVNLSKTIEWEREFSERCKKLHEK